MIINDNRNNLQLNTILLFIFYSFSYCYLNFIINIGGVFYSTDVLNPLLNYFPDFKEYCIDKFGKYIVLSVSAHISLYSDLVEWFNGSEAL